ncbi:helix-turn-helix transcriptional regulator [bacterium]|nr:helix-turn-helix transcriptional regulator [bacterium]
MTIGKRIKELKIALKLTSGEIAAKLDIPVRTIGSYERDEAQPGPKFLSALITILGVNINWLLTGKGNMFLSEKAEYDLAYISKMQDKFKLSDEELKGLIDILEADASREMIIKFIQIKKGNKEALDSLIYNLQGIKAIYG